MSTDPFGTSSVRERVLAAWAAAPVRFREDANAEEDLALGGYRDRLVVELAQNAADAAARAGVTGRLLLALQHVEGADGAGAVLVAANTGAPLDTDGVQALSTLRASAKGEGTVGRFGVGFAAVLSVTDEPAVVSRHGGVRFSAADTRDLVEHLAATAPGLGVELSRRGGHVPVLRLPFMAEGTPPTGYDTAVILPLRDDAALEVVLHRLAEIDDALLLALPGLDEITVTSPGEPSRTLRDVGSRWSCLHREGRFAPELLAGRPTEERARPGWSLTWAVPRGAEADSGTAEAGSGTAEVPRVLHAPTPTDEPLPWPALLLATFPLDPTRRHVAPGSATDALVRAAATAYADLLADLATAGTDVLPFVPLGLPVGLVDGALRVAVAAVLPTTPLLPAAEDRSLMLRPRDAVVIDGAAGTDPALVAALAPRLAGLVEVRRGDDAALRTLGVPRLSLGDVVEALPASGDPQEWRDLYAALAPAAADPAVREELAALPVPLADGRVVRGARGLLLVDGGDPLGGSLAALGVRAVHPAAAHPVLERLGARPARVEEVLRQDAVREAVRAAVDAEEDGDVAEARDVAEAVLSLVAAAVADGVLAWGELPWLAELPLPDADGVLCPAGALAVPGSFAAGVLDPDDVGLVDPGVLDRWGERTLRAVGVLAELDLVQLHDVGLSAADEDGPAADLDGWQDWADEALAAAEDAGLAVVDDVPVDVMAAELVAVRDLDAVRTEAWPRALTALAAGAATRRAVTESARLVAGGRALDVPSYTAWWLRRELAGGAAFADPEADDVVRALLPPPPSLVAGVDAGLRRALGAVTSLAALGAEAVPAVLERTVDPGLELPAATALLLWRRLASLAAAGAQARPPERVRVLAGRGTAVVDAGRAVVVDVPQALQVLADRGVVLCPSRDAEALADLLDLPLAGDVVPGRVAEDGLAQGQRATVPAPVPEVLPGAPSTWCEHDRLVVDGADVDWWVDVAGTVHAATMVGLARALAWRAGAWELRYAVEAVLVEPEAVTDVLMESAFGQDR